MSKHSIRSGSDSRLSASRSSSSASTRRARRVAAAACSDASACRAFSAASSASRRFSPRSARRTSTREPRRSRQELLERREVAGLLRHDDLRRHRRRRAVVLDAERLEHRRHVLLLDVLEVERVAVDHLAAAEREDLHDAAVALEREPEHVDVADVAPVGRLPLGEVLDREEPVAVARRLLEALLVGRLAHPPLELALDRLGVAGEELRRRRR